MKKLLAWLMAVTLTFQLVTPVFAEEIEETQTATEAVEVETEAPTTEIPTTEPTTTDAMETAAPEETSAPTESQPTTEVTEATETTASTEETTSASTEPTLDLLSEDENVIASGECGNKVDNLTWVLTKDGTFTISGTGGMQYYPSHYDSEISDYITITPWYDYREQITTLLVEPGVTNLQNDAFSGCQNLMTVRLPESLDYIGSGVFENCLGLTNMVIPDAVYYIGGQTFSGCANLASVTLPDSLTSLPNQLFENCASLKSINIPASVTGIDYGAFIGCTALTSIVIPGKAIVGWNAFAGCTGLETAVMLDGVSGIGLGSFTNCSALKTVVIPDTVASIGAHAFSGCASLESVAIPGKVTVIEQCSFQDCANLKSVTIPETITSIGNHAFSGCSSLTSVTIPEGVTSIGDGTFWDCRSLTTVTIPKSVTSIGSVAFCHCSSLTSVTIPEGVTSIGGQAFLGCSSLASVTIPESVSSIEWSAFSGCSSLTSVTIPDAVTSIESDVFYGCSSLTSITIPEDVTSIGGDAFRDCSSLTSVTIPDNVTNIGSSAFSGCNSLKSMEIKGAASIGDSAFYYCKKLANVTFSGNVTSIGDSAFSACERLVNVVLPESVTDIGANAFSGCKRLTSVAMPGVISIGADAFCVCESLTSVALPKSVSSIAGNVFVWCFSLERISVDEENKNYVSVDDVLFDKNCQTLIAYPPAKKNAVYKVPQSVTTIESDAFRCCRNLTNVTIPDGVTSIGDRTFLDCSGLTSVNIPKGATSIGEDTFARCALTKLTIPEGVTQIGDDAFRDCDRLTSVVIPGSVASIGQRAFSGCYNFTNIVISNGVKNIGECAFENCRKLIKLWLPKTVTFIDYEAFSGCANLKNVYYGGSVSDWNAITIEDGNAALENAKRTYGVTETPCTEIRPVGTTALISGSKLTLTAWVMPNNKKVKAKWSLSEDSKAYASISSSGVLTAKAVSEVQDITVIATPTDGSPEARKEIQILPKITVKQAEKFNLFHSYSRAELAITGGKVDCALLDGNKDFVLENENDHFYIRFANPENPPAKPNTKATLQVFFPGSDTPATKALTISTTNTAPKLKLNPTSSILNTKLIDGLTVEAEVLGTEDESLKARSVTKGVTASIKSGKLVVTLDTEKTTTATIYLKGNDWAKEVKLTHKITVTEKKPTVKFTAKGKLDVLNPASEIVYTPKLTNAAGTITDVRLEGQDANLFNAEVVDGLVHLKLAESGENYATKKTYKVTPIVTLLGKDITGPTLSVKVTQSTLKLAKLPNLTVYQSQATPLSVKLAVTSPTAAEIGDVQLNAKTTAALRNALKAAGGINFEADTVTFPASAFAALKPGKYTVILDVFPFNAASDTKPIQAKFTLTVQK